MRFEATSGQCSIEFQVANMRNCGFRRVRKLAHLAASAGYRRGLKHGVAAAIEHEGAMRALQIGTMIDVGANIGQFSLLAQVLHPGITIRAFEPLPFAADRFERLFAHDRNVRLHRLAAGEAVGTAELHVSGRPDSSSLLPITDLQNNIFPGTAQASIITVQIARVDDVLEDTDFPEPIVVKLDVQGFEIAALKGMPSLLQRARHVYTEVSFKELYEGQPLAHDVVAWLADAHFRFAGAYNPTEAADGSPVQADILFTRS